MSAIDRKRHGEAPCEHLRRTDKWTLSATYVRPMQHFVSDVKCTIHSITGHSLVKDHVKYRRAIWWPSPCTSWKYDFFFKRPEDL